MMTILKNILATTLATAALAALPTAAQATVVTVTANLAVPANIDGVYINFVTGATGTTTPPTGYDFNPYSATAGLSFFWPSTPTASSGGVAATTTGPYLDLGAGSVVSAASVFSTTLGATPTAAFRITGTHNLGFRFFNEATSAVNYGYVTLTTTATTGFPATVTGWSYENNGGAITVAGNATPTVPEPATWAMMLAGFGAVGFSLRRRSVARTATRLA